MAKKDTPKQDDLELNEKDAEAVKGGVMRKVHKPNVARKVHQGPGVKKQSRLSDAEPFRFSVGPRCAGPYSFRSGGMGSSRG